MAKIIIQGNASGDGILTIQAPNTGTDRTSTLPDSSGTLLNEGSSLDSTKLSGALPALDGSALTGLVHTDSTKLPLAGGILIGDLSLRDNVKAQFGDSNDLQIYHDGSNSLIKDVGTGNLYIDAASLILRNDSGEKYIDCNNNSDVRIYHNNSLKLATTSTGIDVTGNVVVSGTVDGVDIASRDSTLTSTTTTAGAALPKAGGTMTGSFTLNDNVKIQLGTSDDLQIYHDGSASYISDVGTGSLYLRGTNLVMDSSTGEKYIDCIANADVKLFYDNSSKLATTSSGIDVTGTVAATSFTGDGSALTGISAGPSHTSSGTAPSSPSVGDKWHDTTNEKLYMRTNDGTSDLWLQI